MNNSQSDSRNFLPWHLSWLTIILGLLAVGTFIAISGPGVRYGVIMGGGYSGGTKGVPPSPIAPMMETNVSSNQTQGMPSSLIYPYPYQNPNAPVTDTREFLKIYYSASMSTRDVPGLTRRVETTVRGYSGRIDQESSSSQYGSVSFAVSQAKFDAFRTELEDLVGSRFLSINISSQNLLPQKLSIEEQQKQADSALADFKAARQQIISVHVSTVQSLQTKIDADAAQLATLRTQTSTPQLLIQIQAMTDDWTALKQQLASENASYTTQLAGADANIKYAQEYQKAVETQDQTFLDTVATVTGTVSIQWISLWDIALLYLPGYWIPAIFAALTVLSYRRDRHHSLTLAS